MKKLFGSGICIFILVFFSGVAWAAGLEDAFDTGSQEVEGGTGNISQTSPLGQAAGNMGYDISVTNVLFVPQTLIQILLSFLGIVFVILMIYGGYLWMTAHGNDDQLTKAKKLMTAAIIGIVVVLAAYAITWFVMNQLSTQTLQS